jgi:hypothetical protein
MWKYILTNVTLSLAIIYLIHHIWNYLRDNYTTKKTKDLVDFQTKKYKDMLAGLAELETSSPNIPSDGFIPPEEKEWMIRELKTFIDHATTTTT